jgi:hypothetical protein
MRLLSGVVKAQRQPTVCLTRGDALENIGETRTAKALAIRGLTLAHHLERLKPASLAVAPDQLGLPLELLACGAAPSGAAGVAEHADAARGAAAILRRGREKRSSGRAALPVLVARLDLVQLLTQLVRLRPSPLEAVPLLHGL